MRYISLDTETGGLGLDKSLLTLGIVIANDNFKVLAEHHWHIKPNDGIYKVTGKALEINGIDLKNHDATALTEKDTGTNLYNTLHAWSAAGKDKLVVIGKQVDGDIAHIWDKLLKRETWEQFVSYQKIDVSALYWTMRGVKAFPADLKGSLKDIAIHYGMDISDLHDALGDARLTLRVYAEIVKEIEDWRKAYFEKYVG